jgi:hypothetical protein
MACTSPRLRGNLPICVMSLRALPQGVRYPCGNVVLLDPDLWQKHFFEDEECRCHTPNLEWCVSPLGAAVEVVWSSADHILCIPAFSRHTHLLHLAHPGIVAEVHFINGETAKFVRLIRSSPVAVAYLLSIAKSFRNAGQLAEAQHLVRALLARDAADLAVQAALR